MTLATAGDSSTISTSANPTIDQLNRPIDEKKRKEFHSTIRGEVRSIIFRDPDTQYVIVELASGQRVKGEDPDGMLVQKQAFQFCGRWRQNGKWGQQFEFDLAMHDVPGYRDSVVNYLVDNADGIGKVKAGLLWDHFGADTIEKVRTDPQACADATGIKIETLTEAAEKFQELFGSEKMKLELYRQFSGHGFPKKLCAKVLRTLGPKSAEIIQRDPLKLHVDFKMPLNRCDRLYLDLGGAPDKLKRQALWAVQGSVSDEGSTWVPRQRAIEEIYAKCGKNHPGINVERAINVAVRAKFLAQQKIGESHYLAIYERAANERKLARFVQLHSSGDVDWPTIPESAGLSDHQRDEIAKALAGPIGLLMGSAGTGKTYTTAAIVREIIKRGADNVAVCAPTGKAAVRITEAMRANGVKVTATTIHKLLAMRPNEDGAMFPAFTENEPIKERFIVIDEASMLDVDLSASLVSACPKGSHILFVGDPYQLPPVGHGAPLRDLAAAGIPHGLLTEIRRNAGAIVRACKAIKDNDPPKFPDKINYATGDNLKFIPAATASASLDALSGLIDRIVEKHAQDSTNEPNPIWGVQVLSGVNKRGDLCRKKLNPMLQTKLNGNSRKLPANPFRVGDKIICLKNNKYNQTNFTGDGGRFITDADGWSYVRNERPDDGSKKGLGTEYVANGELGEVYAIAEKTCVLKFTDPERFIKIVKIRSDEDLGDPSDDDESPAFGNFDLAYACTVHKYQGSEVPIAIIMLDDGAGLVASREWHYTAISRAKRLCVMIGKKDTLEKQSRRAVLNRRKTLLAELIKEQA